MSDKPLGRKAYGSIGHLPGSRLGTGDHSVNEGQARICTEDARGRTVWVQTKLDGSCVAAALLESGELVALGRAGYTARSSQYEMHHLWADWVDECAEWFRDVLKPGERIVGEWLAQAHGTKYDLNGWSPFVAFDIMRDATRLPYMEFFARIDLTFQTPDTITGPRDPEEAIGMLDHYGAESPEGVVYRVESKGKVDFLAKYVRHDKQDGLYLKGEPVWNWRPNV